MQIEEVYWYLTFDDITQEQAEQLSETVTDLFGQPVVIYQRQPKETRAMAIRLTPDEGLQDQTTVPEDLILAVELAKEACMPPPPKTHTIAHKPQCDY